MFFFVIHELRQNEVAEHVPNLLHLHMQALSFVSILNEQKRLLISLTRIYLLNDVIMRIWFSLADLRI